MKVGWIGVSHRKDARGNLERLVQPNLLQVEIFDTVGITVGSAQRILSDLVDAGFVERQRHGRRNRYVVNRDAPMLRHAAQDGQEIGGLLELLRLDHRTG